MDDSGDEHPSPYLKFLGGDLPSARKAVTINTENPLNRAEAYPSLYIGVDAKKLPEGGKFPVRGSANAWDTADLVVAALKPNSVAAHAAARDAKPVKGKKPPAQAYWVGIDAAPGRTARLAEYEIPKTKSKSPYVAGLLAVAEAAKKRKRDSVIDPSLGEDGDVEAEPIESALRKKTNKVRKFDSNDSNSATIQNLDNDSNSFAMQNPYAKLPLKEEDALEADQYLMEAFRHKLPWDEVVREWKRMSGRKNVDASALSCRHLLIQGNYARNDQQWDEMILTAREKAQDIFDGTELWDRVSNIIKADNSVELRPVVCRRRYFEIVDAEKASKAHFASSRPANKEKKVNTEMNEGVTRVFSKFKSDGKSKGTASAEGSIPPVVGGRYVGVEESLEDSSDDGAGIVDDLGHKIFPRPTSKKTQRLTRKSSDVSSVVSGDKEQTILRDEEYDSASFFEGIPTSPRMAAVLERDLEEILDQERSG